MYEPEPVYQMAVQSTGSRTIPDVSLVSDPATGAWIADPYNLPPDNPWQVVGGTSLAAPSWAGLVALVNEQRTAAGGTPLGSPADPIATQEAVYSMPAADFHDITTGNNGYAAGPGYDLVTGLGTPMVDRLVPDLVAYAGTPSYLTPAGQMAITGHPGGRGFGPGVFVSPANVVISGQQSVVGDPRSIFSGRLSEREAASGVRAPVAPNPSPPANSSFGSVTISTAGGEARQGGRRPKREGSGRFVRVDFIGQGEARGKPKRRAGTLVAECRGGWVGGPWRWRPGRAGFFLVLVFKRR
jgi:hypothetical protein